MYGRPTPLDRENVRGGGGGVGGGAFLPPQQPSGGMWSGWSVPPPGPPPRQHPGEFQVKGNTQTIRGPPLPVGDNWNKKDGTLELQQLMKSLDISEHLPILRVSFKKN